MWKCLLLLVVCCNWSVLSYTTESNIDEVVTLAPKDEEVVSKNGWILTEELYAKAHSYLKGSKSFGHYNLNDTRILLDSLETWIPPKNVSEDFPYYMTGYDYDDRPMWVLEFGKYDPRKYVNEGPTSMAIVERYLFQAAFRLLKSAHEKDTEERDVRDFIVIVDCEGLDLGIVTHPPSIAFAIKLGQAYRDIIEKALSSVILLNANYATRIAYEIARPIVGKIMERVEVFGPMKSKYLPELRRRFPLKSLPPWYGGEENFKPLAVYG